MPSLWPTQLDYQDALVAPTLCFADPDLAAGQVAERSPFGLPLPVTGQFANVYRLALPDGRAFAVRLFLRDQPNRAAHWAALAAHLRSLPSPPECLVPFSYLKQGIALRGEWFPAVKMPWVAGELLNAHVEKRLYDGAALTRVAYAWRDAMAALRRARFAHGDLQHGNILVEPETGALRLVDYDGAFVPVLAGRNPGEAGHPAYQHPARGPADYGPDLDRFPALAVYVALRVLAVAPEVWYRLDNGDNLLFRREDFLNTANSRAFAILEGALRALPAERRLVDVLRAACDTPLSLVPELDTLRL